jgi:hypothetical protein
MRISHHHKYIFISVPKTASTTIRHTLDCEAFRRHRKKKTPFTFAKGADDHIVSNQHDALFYDHVKAIDLKKTCESKNIDWENYYKFAFVRNPWSRLVSCWAYFHAVSKLTGGRYENTKKFVDVVRKHLKAFSTFSLFCSEDSLCEFTRIGFLPSQIDHLTDEDGELLMNFVGKMENLDDDFNSVCKHLGMKFKPLETINTTTHKPYREYYDEKSQNSVAKFYSSDIEAFKYEF